MQDKPFKLRCETKLFRQVPHQNRAESHCRISAKGRGEGKGKEGCLAHCHEHATVVVKTNLAPRGACHAGPSTSRPKLLSLSGDSNSMHLSPAIICVFNGQSIREGMTVCFMSQGSSHTLTHTHTPTPVASKSWRPRSRTRRGLGAAGPRPRPTSAKRVRARAKRC